MQNDLEVTCWQIRLDAKRHWRW